MEAQRESGDARIYPTVNTFLMLIMVTIFWMQYKGYLRQVRALETESQFTPGTTVEEDMMNRAYQDTRSSRLLVKFLAWFKILCNSVIGHPHASTILHENIIRHISQFTPKDQDGKPICFAYAVSAVIYQAKSRILSPEGNGGIPDFEEVRDKVTARFGEDGASTADVIREFAPVYSLQQTEVDLAGARVALRCRRWCLATFRLDDCQWKEFSTFYRNNPAGVLQRLPIPNGKATEGHAVVLVESDSGHLKFLNSWGTHFAEEGYFRVGTSILPALNLKFYDVWWTLDDLSPEEKKAYAELQEKAAAKIKDERKKEIRHLSYLLPILTYLAYTVLGLYLLGIF